MTDNAEKDDELAALKAEVASLKAKIAPEPYDPAAVAKWASDMHALREARMAHASAFSRADLEAMEQACPTSTMRGIVHDNRAPTGRPGVIPSQHLSDARSSAPANTSGWVNPAPLSPPPGIGYVDRLCELDSAKQRGEAMIQEAKIKAAEKAASDEKTNP